jgi:kynurenine formamidase
VNKTRIYDLSQQLSSAMPCYPGDKLIPRIESFISHWKPYITTSSLQLGTHFGTHIDLPRHFLTDGKGVLEFPLEHFQGQALCLRRKTSFNQPLEILQGELDYIKRASIRWVLFYTGFDRFWGEPEYFKQNPFLSENCARSLAQMNIHGVGIDTPSIDAADAGDCDFPVHHIFLPKDILAVENLCGLDLLPDRPFRFFAMPLKMNTEASPVRAFALI